MAFSAPIALTPKAGGGLCLDIVALKPADIIVSTTVHWKSDAIRIGTGSVVSHAALYMGDGQLLEAIGEGVSKTPIGGAIESDALAVVYRHPRMTPTLAGAIIKYAMAQVGKPYAAAGAFGSGLPTGPAQLIYCTTGGSGTSSFFCSQYVMEAFRQGGLPLSNQPAGCVTPGGLSRLAVDKLIYVGHLKGTPSWAPVFSP